MFAHFGTSFFKRIGVRFRGSTSVAVATASYYFIEAPFLRVKDRVANRLRRLPVNDPVLLTPASDGIGPKALE
jgi:peptidoglycan/LPS O-acetylase OafA/YrhL